MRAPFLPSRTRQSVLPCTASPRPRSWAPYVLFAFAVFLLVSYLDQRDARDDSEDYCAAVYAGQIPDWRQTYVKSCRLGHLRVKR